MHGVSRAAAAVAILGATSAVAALVASGAGGAGHRGREAAHGVHLHTLAHFNQPTFAAAPAATPAPRLRHRAAGEDQGAGRRAQGRHLPDMERWVGCCEVETGLLLDRVRAAITSAPASFYVYFTNNQREHRDRPVQALPKAPGEGRARLAAEDHRDQADRLRQPQRRHRRDRPATACSTRRPATAATSDNPRRAPQKKNSLLGKLLRIDPRQGKHGATTGSRGRTRTSASRAATRSTPAASATRSASRSTASGS